MKIKEIMTREVQLTSPEESVKDAAKKMKTFNVGTLPVYDGKTLVGILTDRDIALRCDAEGKDPNNTRISEIMTSQVAWCFDDDSLKEVIRKMTGKQIRRMPVENHENKLVGIISLGDVTLKGSKDLACRALGKISVNHNTQRVTSAV